MRQLIAAALAVAFLAGQVLLPLDDWEADCPFAIPSGQYDDFCDVVLSSYDVPAWTAGEVSS